MDDTKSFRTVELDEVPRRRRGDFFVGRVRLGGLYLEGLELEARERAAHRRLHGGSALESAFLGAARQKRVSNIASSARCALTCCARAIAVTVAAWIETDPTLATVPAVSDRDSATGIGAGVSDEEHAKRASEAAAKERLIALSRGRTNRSSSSATSRRPPASRKCVAVFFTIERAHAEREGEGGPEQEPHGQHVNRATHRRQFTSAG